MFDFVPSYYAYDLISESDRMTISETRSVNGFWDRVVLLPDSGRTLEAEPVIDHPIWSRIANEHGIYQVGDRIRKYTYEFYVDFDWLTEEEVEFIGLIAPAALLRFAETKNAMVQVIERTEAYRSQFSPPVRHSPNHCILGYSSGGRRRFGGEIWSTGTGNGRDVMARTKHQERTLWIWWSNATDEVSLLVTGNVSLNGQAATIPANSNGAQTLANENRIEVTLASCIDQNIDPNDNDECSPVSSIDLQGLMGGVGLDGLARACEINVLGQL
ncbi:MAG: hypothetical protein OHK0039_18040 [Bacteroidia bacterium]